MCVKIWLRDIVCSAVLQANVLTMSIVLLYARSVGYTARTFDKHMRVVLYAWTTVWLFEQQTSAGAWSYAWVVLESCIRLKKTPSTTGSEEKRPLVRFSIPNRIQTRFYCIPGTLITERILGVHGGNQPVETKNCLSRRITIIYCILEYRWFCDLIYVNLGFDCCCGCVVIYGIFFWRQPTIALFV